MTQEFELLELNLIHTRAKYNSPGWKWSRTPELTLLPESPRRFGDKQSEPHFYFSSERKASIIWQALPTMAGQGFKPIGRKYASPWFIIASCINVILWRFFLFKGLFVGQLGQYNFRWQGWITVLFLVPVLSTVLLLYYISQSLSCGKGLGGCSGYQKSKPRH